jgi:hypothetical protein
MSTTDEALKLVQEALESMQIVDFSVENLVGWNKAINAIRKARSAPLQDSDHEFENFHRLLCERFGYTHDEVDWKRDQISLIEWIAKQVKPAAPVQEPVAVARVDDLERGGRVRALAMGLALDAALYTTPAPAPLPLTDEQINNLRQQYGVTSNGRGIKEFTYVVDFARAIEAAHGITEKGQNGPATQNPTPPT